MRLQSPASTGLLPASYSRRRRTRPNEQVQDDPTTTISATITTTYEDDYEDPESNMGVISGNVSPRRSHSFVAKNPVFTLETSTSSGDENDENDERRSYNRQHNHHPNDQSDDKEDVLPKPPTLSDFLVNDACYQRYLMEGKRLKYRGIRGLSGGLADGEKGWYGDPAFLSKLCAGASFVGMTFLIFVAIIIETQPLYIKGVPIKHTNNGDDGTYRFRKETSNALKAAAAYFLTMVLSLIYNQVKDMNLEMNPNIARICHLRRLISSAYFRYRRRHYDDIPDNQLHHHRGSRRKMAATLPLHNNHEDRTLKTTRRRARANNSIERGSGGGGGGVAGVVDAMGGGLGKIKSWVFSGGSSSKGRKKDR